MRLLSLALSLAAVALLAQKYTGPVPPKPDLPYIRQAAALLPMEVADAKSEKRKSGAVTVIAGASSSVQTPLSLPIFILKAEKLAPEHLELHKLDVKDGHREFGVFGGDPPEPIHLEVAKLGADGLCRIAVSDPLEAGEYALSIEGSARVFCFQVF